MTDTATAPSHGSYLIPSLAHAIVADAMHSGLHSCARDTTLIDVARMMSTHHVHCVAVTGDGAPVWGIVSDVDLLRAGISSGAEPTAGDLAKQTVPSVQTSTPLLEATELMLGHGVTHVVVDDPLTERPVGILSTLDVAGVLAWGEA